ncbi:uncharacterized protein associated with GTPases [Beggiatoa alba B18LD]|uniref:Uncharacterized protein associated with GTPases n=1 Tax=Beggiatoa alba B18LD TaxID=395493 RepID=I3CIQ8_9GAMM|nr:GTPase [Beggiatoa alba]EIJ43501.1 uncharacterized protein associated with GTPases [Beggiatoa alba B18LD]
MGLLDTILSPKIDEAVIKQEIEKLKAELPTPVFWLLGKTQAGKTSLIRALTGLDALVIGNGFQACTKTAQLYDFPNSEFPLIRFLDTRGLGEVDYDPHEDMQLFQQQAHVLIVVMKAMDKNQSAVIRAVQTILALHPTWKVIVVQTHLHEGYPSPDFPHILPYPYTQNTQALKIPQQLARALAHQRQLFVNAEIQAHFVPIDFTRAEEGYTPEFYGIDELWQTLENALCFSLRDLVGQQETNLSSIHAEAAHQHTIAYALIAGGAGAIPIPLVGTPVVLAIQVKMAQAIASLYHQPMDSALLMELSSTLGISYLLRLGGRELLKLIPVYGSAVSAVYTGATTYALGQTLTLYFSRVKEGHLPDTAIFQELFQQEFERGKNLLTPFLQKQDPNKT